MRKEATSTRHKLVGSGLGRRACSRPCDEKGAHHPCQVSFGIVGPVWDKLIHWPAALQGSQGSTGGARVGPCMHAHPRACWPGMLTLPGLPALLVKAAACLPRMSTYACATCKLSLSAEIASSRCGEPRLELLTWPPVSGMPSTFVWPK